MANRISNRIKKEKDKGLYKQLFSLVLPITLQNLDVLVSTSDAICKMFHKITVCPCDSRLHQ